MTPDREMDRHTRTRSGESEVSDMKLELGRMDSGRDVVSQRLRVLVVEDYGDLRTALEDFLSALGHRTRFAGNMTMALHVAHKEAFDVLLSDIGLPDGTGWELLRRLRQTGHSPLHTIAMSGYGLDSHLCESAAAGFDLHLIKPLDPEALENMLNGFAAG